MADEEKNGLFNVKDLAGVSVPLTKLIETVGAALGQVSNGVGKVINTYLLAQKDARNEAERIGLVERAKTKAIVDRAEAFTKLTGGNAQQVKTIDVSPDGMLAMQLVGVSAEALSLSQRAEQRRVYQNAMQQLNAEAVIDIAAAELANEEHVAEEPVKIDWTTRLFNIAQDISSEEVQMLLGRILAGEIKKPGSFSLRTLDVLRNLSQSEALIFSEMCNYVADVLYEEIEQSLALFKNGMMNDHEFLHEHFRFDKITDLVDCGLINGIEGSVEPAEYGEGKYYTYLKVGEMLLFAERPEQKDFSVVCSAYFLTRAGAELYKLVEPIANPKYVLDLGLMLEDEGFKVSYSQYNKAAQDIADYDKPLKDFKEFKNNH